MDSSPQPAGLLQQHALPAPAKAIAPQPAPPQVSPKHFLAAFYLSLFLGVFGADRYYLGQYVQGTLKLLTFGWFGIGAIVDLALIMNGAIADSHGRSLAGFPEYKKHAKLALLWMSGVGALLVVVFAVCVYVAVQSVMSNPAVSGLLNSATGGASQSQSETSLLNSLKSL